MRGRGRPPKTSPRCHKISNINASSSSNKAVSSILLSQKLPLSNDKCSICGGDTNVVEQHSIQCSNNNNSCRNRTFHIDCLDEKCSSRKQRRKDWSCMECRRNISCCAACGYLGHDLIPCNVSSCSLKFHSTCVPSSSSRTVIGCKRHSCQVCGLEFTNDVELVISCFYCPVSCHISCLPPSWSKIHNGWGACETHAQVSKRTNNNLPVSLRHHHELGELVMLLNPESQWAYVTSTESNPVRLTRLCDGKELRLDDPSEFLSLGIKLNLDEIGTSEGVVTFWNLLYFHILISFNAISHRIRSGRKPSSSELYCVAAKESCASFEAFGAENGVRRMYEGHIANVLDTLKQVVTSNDEFALKFLPCYAFLGLGATAIAPKRNSSAVFPSQCDYDFDSFIKYIGNIMMMVATTTTVKKKRREEQVLSNRMELIERRKRRCLGNVLTDKVEEVVQLNALAYLKHRLVTMDTSTIHSKWHYPNVFINLKAENHDEEKNEGHRQYENICKYVAAQDKHEVLCRVVDQKNDDEYNDNQTHGFRISLMAVDNMNELVAELKRRCILFGFGNEFLRISYKTMDGKEKDIENTMEEDWIYFSSSVIEILIWIK